MNYFLIAGENKARIANLHNLLPHKCEDQRYLQEIDCLLVLKGYQ